MPPNLCWGDSRPYAVLQRTPDEDCRQAEEPKQLADEASRFHLGRQRQHSAVICADALLFSSRVLHPSLVTLCSHKSGRCIHLPWLPVLSNIEPPALRRKLVEKIVKHDSWPPLLRLTSRKPLWLDLQPVDIKSRWRHNWKSAQVA